MSAVAPFIQIDNALKQYYQRLNHEYHNSFFYFCFNDEMIDDELPMSKELGPESNAENCAYTWLYYQYGFPIPNNLLVPTNKMEEYIYYVLQYCYQHGEPPPNTRMIYYCSPIKKNKNISTIIKSSDIENNIIPQLNESPTSTKNIPSMNYMKNNICNNKCYFCKNFPT